MQQIILAQGVFTLTQESADAALDAIDFIAAAVRGFDAIEVTNIVRPIWREHLAYWFPQLPPATQQWFANAPLMLASIRVNWPLLNPWQRSITLQQWSATLPFMLSLVDPVLARAQALEMESAQRSQLKAWRESAKPRELTSEEAIQELNRGLQQATQLQNFATQMTASTLTLSSALSGHGSTWSAR